MLTPTPKFNCNSPPVLINIKRQAKNDLNTEKWDCHPSWWRNWSHCAVIGGGYQLVPWNSMWSQNIWMWPAAYLLLCKSEQTFNCLVYTLMENENESGFRPPLCTYRLNWARRTSWGWWDDWDDTVLQTQDSKFEPWRYTLMEQKKKSWLPQRHLARIRKYVSI